MSDPSTPNEQEAFDAVAALPARDVSTWRSNAILRRGLAALAFQRRYEKRPWLAEFDRAYTRFVEPALVTGAAVSYIGWALQWIYGSH